MVIAYHVVFSTYGFWLPNDPRGSWSDFVGAWELVRFGKATKVNTTRSVAAATHDLRLRRETKMALKHSPVAFTGEQALAVGRGFAQAAREGGYAVHACAILPEHVHMVIGRSPRSVGRIVGHFKGRATPFRQTGVGTSGCGKRCRRGLLPVPKVQDEGDDEDHEPAKPDEIAHGRRNQRRPDVCIENFQISFPARCRHVFSGLNLHHVAKDKATQGAKEQEKDT